MNNDTIQFTPAMIMKIREHVFNALHKHEKDYKEPIRYDRRTGKVIKYPILSNSYCIGLENFKMLLLIMVCRENIRCVKWIH
jgi:hypothetical protein